MSKSILALGNSEVTVLRSLTVHFIMVSLLPDRVCDPVQLQDQQPAALRKLSMGLDAGSLKRLGWFWYSVAHSIGTGPEVGLYKSTTVFSSKRGFAAYMST